MGYVWTADEIARYSNYYKDIRTHHTYTYMQYQTTREFARSVLPPCLEPADHPTITVAFMAFMEWVHGLPNRAGRDRAAVIGLNARHGDKVGEYYLTVLETEEVNIVTGREFWGMPKKQGFVDFFEDGEQFHGFAGRKEHTLIEMTGNLGASHPGGGEETEDYYFDLRGYGGANAGEFTQPQLVVFKNASLTKRYQELQGGKLILRGSPFDSGVGTIPLGGFIGGAHIGGETSYNVESVIDLGGDGRDYTPYLMGRLYDDWPDLRVERR